MHTNYMPGSIGFEKIGFGIWFSKILSNYLLINPDLFGKRLNYNFTCVQLFTLTLLMNPLQNTF